MERSFWENKWHKGEIGFHQEDINPDLKSYFSQLNLKAGDHVLVPLCGKSLDMLWLLEQGFKVTGVELSEVAILDFFKENSLEYIQEGNRFIAGDLTLICTDIFEYRPTISFDAFYDRAATIALPLDMREKYLKKLTELFKTPKGLVILIHYNQDLVDGPPFSVDAKLLSEYFQAKELTKRVISDLPPKFSDLDKVEQSVFLVS